MTQSASRNEHEPKHEPKMKPLLTQSTESQFDRLPRAFQAEWREMIDAEIARDASERCAGVKLGDMGTSGLVDYVLSHGFRYGGKAEILALGRATRVLIKRTGNANIKGLLKESVRRTWVVRWESAFANLLTRQAC